MAGRTKLIFRRPLVMALLGLIASTGQAQQGPTRPVGAPPGPASERVVTPDGSLAASNFIADAPPTVNAKPTPDNQAPADAKPEPASSPAAAPAAASPALTSDAASIEHKPFRGGPADKDAAGGKPANTTLSWIGSTWWALLLVLGLIFAAAWAVKRWGPGPLRARGAGPFRVLWRHHFSAKQYAALMQVGRRVLLVGVTGQQISLLTEITDQGEIEQLLASCPAGRSILAEGFGQLLGRQRTEMAGEPEEPPARTGQAISRLGQLISQVKSRLARLGNGE